jgi:beta-lactamase regulating signal transducer with metallopeptidase domain
MQVLLQALTYHRYSDEPLSVIVILLVRVTLVVVTGSLASRAWARSSAAVQHRIWLLTILGTLVVPLVWALTPGWRVPLLALEVDAQAVPQGIGATASSAASGWPELLVAVWVVGTLVGLCYTGLGLISARRLFRSSRPCAHQAWLESLAAVERQLHLGRRVELRVTERSISPAVWSFRRVQILVPADSLSWPQSQRTSVLLHELAHVARHDCASQMIANLACAAWWFHPLVWYAAGRMRALGELAADDYVIRAGGPPADYAHELLAIAASLGWARLPGPAQTMFHPSHLERRLRAILDPSRRRNALSPRRSMIGIATACALMIPLATLSPSVVRAVPSPPRQSAPSASVVDVYLKLRVTVPVTPVQLPPGYRRVYPPPNPDTPTQPYLLPRGNAPGQPLYAPPTPPVPPPAAFELLPNWVTGQHAEMLIPNHEPGMSEVVLVEQFPLQAATAAPAVAPSQSNAPPATVPSTAAAGRVLH